MLIHSEHGRADLDAGFHGRDFGQDGAGSLYRLDKPGGEEPVLVGEHDSEEGIVRASERGHQGRGAGCGRVCVPVRHLVALGARHALDQVAQSDCGAPGRRVDRGVAVPRRPTAVVLVVGEARDDIASASVGVASHDVMAGEGRPDIST